MKKIHMSVQTYTAGSRGTRYTVVSECPKCGQVFSGDVYSSSLEAQDLLIGFDQCPVCEAEVLKNAAYSVWDVQKTEASLRSQLKEQIQTYEAEEYRKELHKLQSDIPTPEDMPANNEIVQQIKSDISSLKLYLQRVIALEIWARFLEEHAIKLEQEQTAIAKRNTYSENSEQKEQQQKTALEIKKLKATIDKLKCSLEGKKLYTKAEMKTLIPPVEPHYLSEKKPTPPSKPELKQPTLFHKKKIEAENERLLQAYNELLRRYEADLKKLEEAKMKNAKLKADYEKNLQKYYEELEIEKQRVKAENERLRAEGERKRAEEEQKIAAEIEKLNQRILELKNPKKSNPVDAPFEAMLKKEKNEVLSLLKTVCVNIGKITSVNVVYSNYRDIFALSSFYEYLNSERCYGLEGPDGAYNLYEAERRSDNLSNFFRTLEDIQKNQVVLYKETSKMFRNLESLWNLYHEAFQSFSQKNTDDEDSVKTAFEKYLSESESFRKQINECIAVVPEYVKE